MPYHAQGFVVFVLGWLMQVTLCVSRINGMMRADQAVNC